MKIIKRIIAAILVGCLCLMCAACGGNIHKKPDELAAKAIDAMYGYGDTEMLMELVLPAIKNYSDVEDMYEENYSRMIRELQSDGFQIQAYQETANYTIGIRDEDYIYCEDILNQVGCDGDFEFRAYEYRITATYDGDWESDFSEIVYLVKMEREWYVLVIPFF